MTETKPLRDYSAFTGWRWERLDSQRVRVWRLAFCLECATPGILHDYVLQEDNDRALTSSRLYKDPSDNYPRVRVPFAGGPCLCDHHYDAWLKGKILPSEEQETV